MTVQEAIEFIVSGPRFSIFRLERMTQLLGMVGNPQNQLKFVHIAGTNGKGSTAAMTASILQKAGYKTGLYTSPYIIRYHERMQINGECISDEELVELTEYVKPFAMSLEPFSTPFELTTCIAMLYFARHKCDIVSLEVGMGGEYDATNIILPPEVAVLTNIGLDHTAILGDTLEAIAKTKSGIIKPGCDCVLYEQLPGVMEVVEDVCRERNVPLHIARMNALTPVSHGLEGQKFLWKDMGELSIPLLGEHQLHNAATVLTVIEALKKRGWAIGDEAVREGLRDVSWPGRFQIVRHDPLVIIDGGHNPQCLEALINAFRDYLPGQKIVFLCGCMADKDYGEMFRGLAEFAKAFFTVTPDNPRALSAEALAGELAQYQLPVTPCQSVLQALRSAIAEAGKEGVVCCCGSLYQIQAIDAALKEL